MMTINFTRKEAYAFFLAISSIPLVFFAASLFGVQFLQGLQADMPASQELAAADLHATTTNNSKQGGEPNLIGGIPKQPTENCNLAMTADVAELTNEPDIIQTVDTSDNIAEPSVPAELIKTKESLLINPGAFTVQLASFSAQKNAHALLDELRNVGANSQLLVKPGSSTPYIIASGQYDNLQDARVAARQYNKINHSHAFGIAMAELSFHVEVAKL